MLLRETGESPLQVHSPTVTPASPSSPQPESWRSQRARAERLESRGLALSGGGQPGGEGGDAVTWQLQAPGVPVSYPDEDSPPRCGQRAAGPRGLGEGGRDASQLLPGRGLCA